MRLANKITNVKQPQLIIDCDCAYITIERRGKYGGERKFSWSVTSPTDGSELDFTSEIVNEGEAKKRIELYSDGIISAAEEHSIKLFFNN